jgi:hypothetical protein
MGNKMMTLADTRRMEVGVEYRNMSDLLADFRKYLERDAGTPVERLDANAALLLHDLCQFLKLGGPQQQKVLGRSAASYVEVQLNTRVRLPVIH